MGFGKRVCEILAVIGAIVMIGALAWYFASGMNDKGYDREGTLVWESQARLAAGPAPQEIPGEEEAAFPAFVTDPVSMIYGEQELIRSGKGL